MKGKGDTLEQRTRPCRGRALTVQLGSLKLSIRHTSRSRSHHMSYPSALSILSRASPKIGSSLSFQFRSLHQLLFHIGVVSLTGTAPGLSSLSFREVLNSCWNTASSRLSIADHGTRLYLTSSRPSGFQVSHHVSSTDPFVSQNPPVPIIVIDLPFSGPTRPPHKL